MSLGQWVTILMVIAAFFYLGLFFGYRIAHVFVAKEIAMSNKFLIGNHLYNGFYQCDLSEPTELPEALIDVPASTNNQEG